MEMKSIIQWNCRGLKSNYDEIAALLRKNNPIDICLQETFLKENDNVSFKQYSIYSKTYNDGERASGGVSVIVNNSSPHKIIQLQTNLQAIAVSVTVHTAITICCVYLPPNSSICIQDLDDLISQLPSPFLLLGDFNGHNIIWGCKDTNDRGKKLENFISNHGLCIFNDNKTQTYLHPASGSYSAIDLSICSPNLFLDSSWEIGDDLCGSDHFPIFLTYNGPLMPEKIQRWNLSKADWNLFQRLCLEEIKPEKFENVE